MKRGSSKLSDWGRGGMVSPLVDVVFNLMITMFIFLMIYMIVVLPKNLDPLTFNHDALPPTHPFLPYSAGISVSKGSGDYYYLGNLQGLRGIDSVKLNPTTGVVEGSFLSETNTTATRSRTVELGVLVVDLGMSTQVDSNKAVPFQINGRQVNLFFHQELSGATNLAPPVPNASAPSSDDLATNQVSANYAIRRSFPIEIRPARIPFDPAANPLRLAASEVVVATEGEPLSVALSPLGGIQPYEYAFEGLPTWLRLNANTARLEGIPNAPATIRLLVRLKDAQTAASDWSNAIALRTAPSHPFVEKQVEIIVRPRLPLAATLATPRIVRVGEPFSATVAASGGVGHRRFVASRLPDGLQIDPLSGMIGGIPTTVGRTGIEIVVTDESTNRVVVATPASWPGILPPAPAPQIR